MTKIKTHYKNSFSYYKMAQFLKKYINDNTLIMCIGTDRCIGDCLGPLVGTFLKNKHFPLPIYGTIENPIHALNLNKNLDEIKTLHPNKNIIAIDACLGNIDTIGEIHIRDYPIHPGKGVGKQLPNVGEISIIGIVESSTTSDIFNSNSIRLNLIINIAKVISSALIHGYYLYSLKSDNVCI